MSTEELVAEDRVKAMSLEFSLRFLVLDMCDRLERKTKDNELLALRIAELKPKQPAEGDTGGG